MSQTATLDLAVGGNAQPRGYIGMQLVGEIRGHSSQEYEFRTVGIKQYLIHRHLFGNIMLIQVRAKDRTRSRTRWIGTVIRACLCICRERYG